jgi:hypothetical protein
LRLSRARVLSALFRPAPRLIWNASASVPIGLYAVAAEVLAEEHYTTWDLTTFKYYYVPMGQLGLGGIVLKPTPDLLRLQQGLIDAVTSYTVKTAMAAAFLNAMLAEPLTAFNFSQCLPQSFSSVTTARHARGCRLSRQKTEVRLSDVPRPEWPASTGRGPPR